MTYLLFLYIVYLNRIRVILIAKVFLNNYIFFNDCIIIIITNTHNFIQNSII